MWSEIALAIAEELSYILDYPVYCKPESFCDNEWSIWFKQPNLHSEWKDYLYVEEKAQHKEVMPFGWMKEIGKFVFREDHVRVHVTATSAIWYALYDPDSISKIIKFLLPHIIDRIDLEFNPEWRESPTIMVFMQNAWSINTDRNWNRDSDSEALYKSRTGRRLRLLLGESFHSRRGLVLSSLGETGQDTPDSDYIRGQLRLFVPYMVVACGTIASDVLSGLWGGPIVVVPHPTYRVPSNEIYVVARWVIRGLMVYRNIPRRLTKLIVKYDGSRCIVDKYATNTTKTSRWHSTRVKE